MIGKMVRWGVRGRGIDINVIGRGKGQVQIYRRIRSRRRSRGGNTEGTKGCHTYGGDDENGSSERSGPIFLRLIQKTDMMMLLTPWCNA